MKKKFIKAVVSVSCFIFATGCSNNTPVAPILPLNDINNTTISSKTDKTDNEPDYFAQTDINKDGFIDYKELVTEMLNSQPYFYGDVKEVAKQLFDNVDKNKDKKITSKEYYNFTAPKGKSVNSSVSSVNKLSNTVAKSSSAQANKYFNDSDLNKDGFISYKELLSVMMESQPYFYGDVSEIAKQLMAKIDKNKDGKITKTEYIKGM